MFEQAPEKKETGPEQIENMLQEEKQALKETGGSSKLAYIFELISKLAAASLQLFRRK